MAAVVCLITPTVFHRVAIRTERASRLVWGIRLALAGIALLGASLCAALWCVVRYLYGTATAWAFTAVAVAVIAACWLALPVAAGRLGRR